MFPQTDGASAVLIMSEEKALAMGYKPKAYLRYNCTFSVWHSSLSFTRDAITVEVLIMFCVFIPAETLSTCLKTPKISCFWGESLCVR